MKNILVYDFNPAVLIPCRVPRFFMCMCLHQQQPHRQGFNEPLVKALAAWVSDEYAQSLQQEVDTSTWTLDAPPAPQQHNGCDCGMFMLAYAEHLVRCWCC